MTTSDTIATVAFANFWSGINNFSNVTDATAVNTGGLRDGGGLAVAKRIVGGGGFADASLSSTSWSAAGSLTIGGNTLTTINANTATIASFTVTMPATPAAGQIEIIATSGVVTSFTLSPNTSQTIQGAPTALAANTSVWFIFNGTVWTRLL